MLALAPAALHNDHASTSWHAQHAQQQRRAVVRTHSHSSSHSSAQPPPDPHHATPPHHRLTRSTSTPHPPPVHESQHKQQHSAAETSRPAQVEPPAAPTAPPRAHDQRRAPVDIHAIPQADLLKHLANLLQQIATANDALPSPSAAQPPSATPIDDADRPPIWNTLTTASRGAFANQSTSLAFHARNIPTISLESYLLRILKYCPISNEVFLSLLVYFDRMTRLARETTGTVFAIDSYNVHRLVIAGVTVASKFLSDVFYTNTRYAKVGGLPQAELNQLELQFLLLNDFNLLIVKDEMQKYAEDLMAFAHSHTLPPILADPASYEPQGTNWKVRAIPEVTDHDDVVSVAETGEDDGTTDDEPTIRPAHSSASSETQSIYTLTSEDTDAERDLDDDDDDFVHQ
ncbi:cyclin-domain-containing protein [Exidia glandulosa HHB12029]|uniref:Cyclin-domain-containing protein n=1 Tax=Exidia glandulosa HHB12029 TaxID=1314781 RepID=A0A165QN16_EXIGL|nr:cyclin-domain-containing protein [Exidia glandulosa HHB12029]